MRRNLLPILMSMVLLSPLAIDIYLPSMPTMATEFAVSASDVQSTLVLFLFAMGLGQVLIGPLADRYGRRPVAIFGVLLYGASSLLAAAAIEFHWLQIARLLQGLAACSTSIVVFSAVRDCYSQKEGAKIYSYLNGAICVIPALAPTLGGLLAMQFGWRSTFVFMTLYAMLMMIVVGYRLPETRPANTVTTGPLYRWSRYKPVLGNTHFLFYALACMSAMAAILSYVSYAPVWLIGHLGVSELAFSGLFGLNAVFNIVACFAAPIVIRKLGNRPTVVLALVLLILSSVAVVVAQLFGPSTGMAAAFAFMLPMMLLCVGFAFLLGPATSMALSAFGERAGTAAAMLGFIQMSGASILAGLVQQTDLTAPYAVALVMGVSSIGLLVMMALSRFDHWHQEQLTTEH
ncbi:multidrug effflux MFS transporter [Shewanella glacialipiscicola]|uniref:Bcr/CflA family efflux transporter n=1 Tax=Shewanella glacialipiscicola TaxID=614069 RepID=A0ABQ6J8C2_9GAMM|nr:multidrug effflux MFS transporter [Shewanella glacialipiscicola]MCL1085491.1 multidrug effflux MFS transporter [Shewanella glacialipiscicola]GIU16077.1 Bcr/CflA family drug resistance efflux transporter [Shewanella glacialipiscicola]GMA83754.1 Bcr/CflA family drug resistance efflux transporter [Shewanella glacialipiscicola]